MTSTKHQKSETFERLVILLRFPTMHFDFNLTALVEYFSFSASLFCRRNLTQGVGRFREILRAVETRTTQNLRMVRNWQGEGVCRRRVYDFYAFCKSVNVIFFLNNSADEAF